jgi:hypothetical protein
MALLRREGLTNQGFDPISGDYDIETANRRSFAPDATGHMQSRDPMTGLILKALSHPTFSKTVLGERDAGFDFSVNDGRVFSQPRDKQ